MAAHYDKRLTFYALMEKNRGLLTVSHAHYGDKHKCHEDPPGQGLFCESLILA